MQSTGAAVKRKKKLPVTSPKQTIALEKKGHQKKISRGQPRCSCVSELSRTTARRSVCVHVAMSKTSSRKRFGDASCDSSLPDEEVVLKKKKRSGNDNRTAITEADAGSLVSSRTGNDVAVSRAPARSRRGHALRENNRWRHGVRRRGQARALRVPFDACEKHAACQQIFRRERHALSSLYSKQCKGVGRHFARGILRPLGMLNQIHNEGEGKL